MAQVIHFVGGLLFLFLNDWNVGNSLGVKVRTF